MRTRLSFVFSAGAVFVLTGCGLLDSLAAGCDASYNFGLAVHVRDSVTGAGIASGAQLVVNGVGYVDSVSVPEARPDLDSLAIPSAGERPGLYIVTVRKDGYQEWTSKPVHVTEDGCHVPSDSHHGSPSARLLKPPRRVVSKVGVHPAFPVMRAPRAARPCARS